MSFRIGQIYRYYYVVCGPRRKLWTSRSLYVFRALPPGATLDRDWNCPYEYFPYLIQGVILVSFLRLLQ